MTFHVTLVSALRAAGIRVGHGEEWSCEYLAQCGDLYLTWDVENGIVKNLHSTPYTGEDMMTLEEINYSQIVYHKSAAGAVRRLTGRKNALSQHPRDQK